ncbi:hypothetical protein NQZ79_g8525 [Umbelopsis isabellina]|nr:hypothetical protein NQZ79_g8525 [Umbelopsis isabellina]
MENLVYSNSTYSPPLQQPSPQFQNKFDYMPPISSNVKPSPLSHAYGYSNAPPLSVDPQQPVPQQAMYGQHHSTPGNIMTPSATPPSMNQPTFSAAPWPSSTYSDMQFNNPSYFQPPSRTPNPPSTPNLSQEPSNMMYMPSYDPSFQQPNNTIAFPATTPPLPTPQSNRAQESPHPMYRSNTTQLTYSRPKLSTTIWEDEGTVCYQVDAKGICVARRQDNDMVNGTKLLNVAGMSRGKRDGILKNEKGRVVVKVGAMHLKGVWVTFSRAKALAAQYKISDVLYPLFVNDPSIFLYSNASTVPSTPRPTYGSGRQTPQRSMSSNTSITWQSNSSNENDQGFDTSFQNASQPSVQTNILSADNPQDSYMLDYSRSQFITGIVPSYNGVSDYYTQEDENARYKFEKI